MPNASEPKPPFLQLATSCWRSLFQHRCNASKAKWKQRTMQGSYSHQEREQNCDATVIATYLVWIQPRFEKYFSRIKACNKPQVRVTQSFVNSTGLNPQGACNVID